MQGTLESTRSMDDKLERDDVTIAVLTLGPGHTVHL